MDRRSDGPGSGRREFLGKLAKGAAIAASATGAVGVGAKIVDIIREDVESKRVTDTSPESGAGYVVEAIIVSETDFTPDGSEHVVIDGQELTYSFNTNAGVRRTVPTGINLGGKRREDGTVYPVFTVRGKDGKMTEWRPKHKTTGEDMKTPRIFIHPSGQRVDEGFAVKTGPTNENGQQTFLLKPFKLAPAAPSKPSGSSAPFRGR